MLVQHEQLMLCRQIDLTREQIEKVAGGSYISPEILPDTIAANDAGYGRLARYLKESEERSSRDAGIAKIVSWMSIAATVFGLVISWNQIKKLRSQGGLL